MVAHRHRHGGYGIHVEVASRSRPSGDVADLNEPAPVDFPCFDYQFGRGGRLESLVFIAPAILSSPPAVASPGRCLGARPTCGRVLRGVRAQAAAATDDK